MNRICGNSVLVTGADGFIGSHLVERLLSRGVNVRALCLYNSFNHAGWLEETRKKNLANLEIIFGDIRDPEFVGNTIIGCNVVFHLAALIAIPYSYLAPSSYIDTNVVGTLNVLNACLRHGVRKVIHTSTSEVYGSAQYVPIDEGHVLNAQSPYAASKIGADQLALSYQKSFDLPVVVARPFNTFGPRQSARAVIPTVISQLASSSSTIKLGSLLPTREFNYIDDTVSGFCALASGEEGIGHVFNIGNNTEISIGDLVLLIQNLMGTDKKVETEDSRVRPVQSEVMRLRSDPTKINTVFGWNAKYAGVDGLAEGLRPTIKWFLESGAVRSLFSAEGYTV